MCPKVRRLPEETSAEGGFETFPTVEDIRTSQCTGVDFHTQEMGALGRADRPLPQRGPCSKVTQANPDAFWRWCWTIHKVTECPQSACAVALNRHGCEPGKRGEGEQPRPIHGVGSHPETDEMLSAQDVRVICAWRPA